VCLHAYEDEEDGRSAESSRGSASHRLDGASALAPVFGSMQMPERVQEGVVDLESASEGGG
jgi:hypothetical protein